MKQMTLRAPVLSLATSQDKSVGETMRQAAEAVVDGISNLAESVVAIGESLSIDAGVGGGLGVDVQVDVAKVSVVSAIDAVHIKVDRNGVDIGSYINVDGSIGIEPFYGSTGRSSFHSFFCDQPASVHAQGTHGNCVNAVETSNFGNFTIVSVGGYLFFGASASLTIDGNYLDARWREIWSD